jgi:hypothetical protein
LRGPIALAETVDSFIAGESTIGSNEFVFLYILRQSVIF